MLKFGDTLQFIEKDRNTEIIYEAQIVSVDQDYLYIDYPKNKKTDKIAFLLDHTDLVITSINNNAEMGQQETLIIGRVREPHPQLIILHPNTEKQEEDKVLQVNTNVDAALHLNNHQKLVGKTIHLSARKCTAIFKDEVLAKKNDQGKIYIVLPMDNGTYHYLQMLCKIDSIETKGDFTYVTILFLDNQFCERELIHFCFEKELEYRKKTLESL